MRNCPVMQFHFKICLNIYIEEICVKRLYTSRKGKSKMNGEDVAMSEDRPSTKVNESQVTTEGSVDQWSPVESLTPLGERLLQLPVSLVTVNLYTSMFN